MESHKIWVANLQDLIINHICQGFLKTYNELFRLCGGHKIKISIQTAMEGIPHLSCHKISADYKILLESLAKSNCTEKNLMDLIKNCYMSYAKSALSAAGLNCDFITFQHLTGPLGGAFVHEVYINVARVLWSNPDILVNAKTEVLKHHVKEAVEKSIRDGVNLSHLSAMAEADKEIELIEVKALKTESIKDKLTKINGGKSLLDDENSDSDITEDTADQEAMLNHAKDIVSMPDTVSFTDENLTIEHDDFAPDNVTIPFSESESDIDADLQEHGEGRENSNQTAGIGNYDVILEGMNDDIPSELVQGRVIGEESIKSTASVNTLNTVKTAGTKGTGGTTGTKAANSSVKTIETDGYVLESLEGLEGLDGLKSLKSLKSSESLKSLKSSESLKSLKGLDGLKGLQKTDFSDDTKRNLLEDTISSYTVTLLSHDDMLSSRLEKIGAKRIK